MNRAVVREGVGTRAKSLRLGEGRVGLHVPQGAPANDTAPPLRDANSTPGQPRSARRANTGQAIKALIRNSFKADGVAVVDAAAACDRQPQHVSEMLVRDIGARTITAADLVAWMQLSPTLRAGLVEMTGGAK